MSENKSQKTIEVDGWRVYDWPVQYTEADYEEARAEVTAKLKQIPELGALFEWGYIPAPGISDMDFRAVFPEDASRMYIPREPAFSEKTKYLTEHEPFLISEKHYRQTLYFDPWTMNVWPNGHKLLYQRSDIKRDLNFEKIEFSCEERDALSASRVEIILEEIYSLIPFYARKELPIREVLESLKGCIYVIREINLITGRTTTDNFSKDFEDLRSNWFSLREDEAARRLIALLQRGLLISFGAAFSLGEWLSQHSDSKPVGSLKIRKTGSGNGVYLATFGERRVFNDAVKTAEQALEMSLKSCRKVKIGFGPVSRVIDFYIIFQPLGMASMLLGMADEKGLLSDHLKKDIFTNQENVPVFKPKVVQERNRIINEITETYNKKQVVGLGCKGWFFSSRFGYLFGQEGLKRKFVNFLLRRKFWQTVNQIQ